MDVPVSEGRRGRGCGAWSREILVVTLLADRPSTPPISRLLRASRESSTCARSSGASVAMKPCSLHSCWSVSGSAAAASAASCSASSSGAAWRCVALALHGVAHRGDRVVQGDAVHPRGQAARDLVARPCAPQLGGDLLRGVGAVLGAARLDVGDLERQSAVLLQLHGERLADVVVGSGVGVRHGRALDPVACVDPMVRTARGCVTPGRAGRSAVRARCGVGSAAVRDVAARRRHAGDLCHRGARVPAGGQDASGRRAGRGQRLALAGHAHCAPSAGAARVVWGGVDAGLELNARRW